MKLYRLIPKNVLDFIMITVGAVIYSASISMIITPAELVPGGVTGVSVIANRLTSIPVGLFTLMLNIPLLIIGVKKLGVRFLAATIYTVVLTSVLIDVFTLSEPLLDDLFTSAAAGGALLAVGLGLVFKGGATTGGADIVVRLIRIKHRHLRTGQIYMIADGVVVALYAMVCGGFTAAVYSAASLYISSHVLDRVLYGSDGAKLIYVISAEQEKIAKRFLSEVGVGVTYLSGKGAYTGNEKQIVFCAVRKQLLPKAQQIVSEEDASAFMIVTTANDVFGEGYKRHDEKSEL